MTISQEQIEANKKTGNIEFFPDQRHADYVISRMPVTPAILNPYGVVQAGAMKWLADVAASALTVEGQPIGTDGEGFPRAIEIHTAMVSNRRDGEIKAEARFVRRGKNVLVVRTRATGNGGKSLAEVTTTHIWAR